MGYVSAPGLRRACRGHWPFPALPGLPRSAPGLSEAPRCWPGPHQLVFDEVAHDFVVEVLDGGPADALLYILLLGRQSGRGWGWGLGEGVHISRMYAAHGWAKKVGQVSPHAAYVPHNQSGLSPGTKPVALCGAGQECHPWQPWTTEKHPGSLLRRGPALRSALQSSPRAQQNRAPVAH